MRSSLACGLFIPVTDPDDGKLSLLWFCWFFPTPTPEQSLKKNMVLSDYWGSLNINTYIKQRNYD